MIGTLGEPLASVALGAEGEFSVDDRFSERSLSGVVGGLDLVDRGEGPERGPDLEQVVGELPVPAVAPSLGAGLFEQPSEFGLDRRDLGLETIEVERDVASISSPTGS